MTLEEVNQPHFKYKVYFTSNPRVGSMCLIRHKYFVSVVEILHVNHNDYIVRLVQDLYRNNFEFSKYISRFAISLKNSNRFVNKIGVFVLREKDYPELFL